MMKPSALALAAVGTCCALAAVGAHGATVFYTACDGTSDSDTVKVKKVEEDGSGTATLADTTLPGCGTYTASKRWPTGLAVSDGYAYFSWQSAAGTGIGRVALAGGAANADYIAGPAGAQRLRLNSNVAGGYLFAYADDGDNNGNPVSARIARAPVGGGTFSNVFTALGGLPLSFGLAGDTLYYSTSDITLEQSNLDGTSPSTTFINFPAGGHMGIGASAALVAGSSSKVFVYTLNGGQNGYSTLAPPSLDGTFTSFGAVPASTAPAFVDGQVWSGSHLYFTQADNSGTSVAIGRVAGDGTGLNRAWHAATRLHQIAIGTLPSTPASGGSSAGSTTKASLDNVINTTAVKKVTTLRRGSRPSASIPCSTTTNVALASCKVEIIVGAKALKKVMAKAPKMTVIGTATRAATGSATSVTVKVPIRNKKARKALSSGKRLRATITMTVTGADGSTGTASKATTLVLAKARAKKKWLTSKAQPGPAPALRSARSLRS